MVDGNPHLDIPQYPLRHSAPTCYGCLRAFVRDLFPVQSPPRSRSSLTPVRTHRALIKGACARGKAPLAGPRKACGDARRAFPLAARLPPECAFALPWPTHRGCRAKPETHDIAVAHHLRASVRDLFPTRSLLRLRCLLRVLGLTASRLLAVTDTIGLCKTRSTFWTATA